MKRNLTLAVLIIGTIASTVHARGFGGGLAGGLPVGDGIGGSGALWTDSIYGAGGMWGNGAYGTGGLPAFETIPGAYAAYGGFFSGPPADNLASKSPGAYHPLAGEQSVSEPQENYRAERMQSFNSSLAGMGIQTGGFQPGQFGPPPGQRNSSAGMPSDLGLHQAGSQRSSKYSGNARNVAAADSTAANGARNWSTADLRVLGNSTRSSFRDYNVFGRDWFTQYPNAWYTRGYARGIWMPASWDDVTTWFGGELPPYEYTYGNELTYENDDVCIDGRPIATADKYYASATAIAQTGERANSARDSAPGSWLPLGVFQAIPSGATSGKMLIQLAINKAGIIRGNYFDPPAKNMQLIQGAMDKDTERAAWVVADKKNIIFDCVLYNLTKSETPVLVHIGADKPEQWILVRLNPPTVGGATR